MTKRLSRKDLKRELEARWRDIETLGDQLLAEEEKRSEAGYTALAAEQKLEKAEKELQELRRQLSNARDAQEKLRQALYPGQYASGGLVKPGAVPGVMWNVNAHDPGDGESIPEVQRRYLAQAKDWAGPL